MKKRAFIVVGPESSGTRLLTRILMAAGCDGDGGHKQRFDQSLPTEDLIVWRRSVPHGANPRPNIEQMVKQLKDRDYDVRIIVMIRDFLSNVASQVRNNHTPTPDTGLASVRSAMIHIWSSVQTTDVPAYVVTYLSLQSQAFIKEFLNTMGLPSDVPHEMIRPEDLKYYTSAPRPRTTRLTRAVGREVTRRDVAPAAEK